MNATLYNMLLSQLPEKPDLKVVQTPQPCPEQWPLLLLSIEKVRGKINSFIVSDGQEKVTCTSTMVDVYNKVALLEPGAIIHLKGSLPKFNGTLKRYVLEIDNILTLKEADAELNRQKAKEEKRKAKLQVMLQQQGYLEFEHEQAPAKEASEKEASEPEPLATAAVTLANETETLPTEGTPVEGSSRLPNPVSASASYV